MTRSANTTEGSLWSRLSGSLLAATVFAFCATASPARAQINPFRAYKGPTLAREDLAAGRDAARKLLDGDQPSVGQAESWTGPSTGNQGTLTIRRVFERAGMPCRSLASEVLYRRTRTRSSYTLTTCRTAGGAWKLAD